MNTFAWIFPFSLWFRIRALEEENALLRGEVLARDRELRKRMMEQAVMSNTYATAMCEMQIANAERYQELAEQIAKLQNEKFRREMREMMND